MGELADRAVNLQADAASDFEAMNEFKKMQSIAKCVKFIADVPKIPAFMKQAVKDIEAELSQVKALKDYLSQAGAFEKLAADGKKCAAAKIFDPAKCFNHINPNEGNGPKK